MPEHDTPSSIGSLIQWAFAFGYGPLLALLSQAAWVLIARGYVIWGTGVALAALLAFGLIAFRFFRIRLTLFELLWYCCLIANISIAFALFPAFRAHSPTTTLAVLLAVVAGGIPYVAVMLLLAGILRLVCGRSSGQ